jgi:hypothetical protein
MGDRNGAIARVEEAFDCGAFFDVLNERIKIESTSQEPKRAPELARYLHDNIGPALEAELGCTWEVLPNPVDAGTIAGC